MILVTHEMRFAQNVSNHVIYLHDGMVEESGPPDKLFAEPESPRLRKFVASAN